MTRAAARYGLYTLVVVGLLAALPFFARHAGAQAFKFEGALEAFQFVTITVAAVLLFGGAWWCRACRALLVGLGTLALVAVAREQNNALRELVPFVGWTGVAAPILVLGFTVAGVHRRALLQQVRHFLGTAAFGIMWSGLLVVGAFAQLVGHGPFLKVLMGDTYDPGVKQVIQELCETFGYVLIFIGAVETLRYARAATQKGGLRDHA